MFSGTFGRSMKSNFRNWCTSTNFIERPLIDANELHFKQPSLRLGCYKSLDRVLHGPCYILLDRVYYTVLFKMVPFSRRNSEMYKKRLVICFSTLIHANAVLFCSCCWLSSAGHTHVHKQYIRFYFERIGAVGFRLARLTVIAVPLVSQYAITVKIRKVWINKFTWKKIDDI